MPCAEGSEPWCGTGWRRRTSRGRRDIALHGVLPAGYDGVAPGTESATSAQPPHIENRNGAAHLEPVRHGRTPAVPDAGSEQPACRHQWLAVRCRQDTVLDPRLRGRTYPADRRLAVRARPDSCCLRNCLLHHQVARGVLSHLPRYLSHSHARHLRRCAQGERPRQAARRGLPVRTGSLDRRHEPEGGDLSSPPSCRSSTSPSMASCRSSW